LINSLPVFPGRIFLPHKKKKFKIFPGRLLASGGQGAFLKNRPLDPRKTFYLNITGV
jgi:hypothetical protein